ncbi:MAG: ATP-binding protein [Rhodospirillales bacterium]
MRIKTAARISAVVILVAVGALVLMNMIGLSQVREVRELDSRAQSINRAVLDLNVLASELQTRRTRRLDQQFDARIKSLLDLLGHFLNGPAEQVVITRRMVASTDIMRGALQNLGKILDRPDVEDPNAQRAQRALMRSFLSASQSLAALSNRLSKYFQARIARIEATIIALTLGTAGVVVLIVAVFYVLSTRGILTPLFRLRDRIKSLALDTDLEEEDFIASNELEEIAHEFDRRFQAQQNAELKLIEYAKNLERSNRDLEDFAYVASHDLRAPLRGIKTTATWIAEDLGAEVSPDTLENLAMLRSRVERMDGLLEGLLKYSRVTSKAYELEKVDLPELVDEIILMVEPPSGMIVTYEGDVPPFPATRVHLQQVLQNLIDNAIKHHDRDVGIITVSAMDDDGFVSFEVRDDGPGIAPEFHDKVTQIFQTLKPRDQHEASGIGLATVKKVVEAHDGTLTVNSPLTDRGCAVCFTWRKEG